MGRKVLLTLAVIVLLVLVIGLPAYFLLKSGSPAEFIDAGPPGIEADTSRLPLVYASDFANHVDEGWAVSDRSESPSGRHFLGKFLNDTATLKIHGLPQHELVRISFDLFIIDTWDGVGRISAARGPCGPDFVEIDVAGGPNLLRATFAALPDISGFAGDGKLQTYPSPIPSNLNAVGAGSSVQNGLGYAFRFGGTQAAIPMDATYPMSFTIPHTNADLTLLFSGSGLQDLRDESWGIADVKVEALSARDLPPIEPAALERWFNTVQKGPAVAAKNAFWDLVARGDKTVAMLRTRATDGFGVNPATIAEWLAAAKAEQPFGPAMQKLIAAGPAAEHAIHDAVAADAGLADIGQKVLQEIEVMPITDPAARKIAAAARLLTTIDTQAARTLHAELSAKPVVARATPAPVAPFKPTKPLYGSVDQIASNRWLVTGGDGAMVANDSGTELRLTYGNNRMMSVPERRLLDTRLATTRPALAESLGLNADQLEQLKQVIVPDMVIGDDLKNGVRDAWLGYLQNWRDGGTTPQQKMNAELEIVRQVHEVADDCFWDTRKATVQVIKQVQGILTADQVRRAMHGQTGASAATQPALERP